MVVIITVIVITVINSGTILDKEIIDKLEFIQRRTNNLVKGLETATCKERWKDLRMFTLENTHFKRKQDSFLRNTKKNCLTEESLVNAVPENAIRIKE